VLVAADQSEVTGRQQRLINIVAVVFSPGSLVLLVVGNLTHRWWPAFTFLALGVLMAALMTAWAARTRHQSCRSTVVQIARNPRRQ
jgi:hypothetical protein